MATENEEGFIDVKGIAVKDNDDGETIGDYQMTKSSKNMGFTRFDGTDWNRVEQKLSPMEMSVIKTLQSAAIYGINDNDDDESKINVMGEELYVANRDKLVKWSHGKLVPKLDKKEADKTKDSKPKNGDKKNKEKKVVMKKEDIIREQNTNKRIIEDFDKVLNTFDKEKMNYKYGIQNKYIELRMITLIYCVWYQTKNEKEKNKAMTEKKRELLYELYIVISKVLKFLESYENMINNTEKNAKTRKISTTAINDLKLAQEELNKMCPFDGLRLYEYAPRLVIYTDFDEVIPKSGIKLRRSQQELINVIDKHQDSGFFISFSAMAGAGKTTTAPTVITTKIDSYNMTNGTNIQLIFCCNIDSVRGEVARVAYNAGIKFGIATTDAFGNIRISNHYSTEDHNRILIVADPKSAHKLLLDDRVNRLCGNGKYWLFVDEPTVDADDQNSQILQDNMKVLMNAPKHTILASATMCDLKHIQSIIDYYKKTNQVDENAFIGAVYSNEIMIGCDVYTFDNERLFPHIGCKTKDDILKTIDAIHKNPFFCRMYTTQVALHLRSLMIKAGIKNLPDIEERFKKVENLSLDKVREVCLEMLMILSNESTQIITKICSTSIKTHEEEPKQESDDDLLFEDEIDQSNSMNLSQLGTYQAYRYPGMNLVMADDPVAFAMKNFETLINDFKKSGKTIKSLNNNYKKKQEIFADTVARLEQRTKNNDIRNQQIDTLQSEHAPKIEFDEVFQINSKDHLRKYAAHVNKKSDKYDLKQSIRKMPVLELINYENINVSDELVMLLYAGVGIYAPSSRILSHEYISTVLEFASNGNLAYVIADKSMSFGTNYPFVRTIFPEDFTQYSINSLLQAMSRAGRVGRSWQASSYVCNTIARVLLEYFKNPNDSDYALVEPTNMITVFTHEVSYEKKLKELEKQKKEKAEMDAIIAQQKLEEEMREKEREKERELQREKERELLREQMRKQMEQEREQRRIDKETRYRERTRNEEEKNHQTTSQYGWRTRNESRNEIPQQSGMSWRRRDDQSTNTSTNSQQTDQPKKSTYVPPHLRNRQNQ